MSQGNAWGVNFFRMFEKGHKDNDVTTRRSHLRLKTIEGKMIWQYNHRHGTFDPKKVRRDTRVWPKSEAKDLANPDYDTRPSYWMKKIDVENRMESLDWSYEWLLAFREATGPKNKRTVIACVLPMAAVMHTAQMILTDVNDVRKNNCLLANYNSKALDWICRQKMSGTHLTYALQTQLPIFPPERYDEVEEFTEGKTLVEWINERVLKLTYTSHDMKPYAEDMGYGGSPFMWDEVGRQQLMDELDQCYFHLYGYNEEQANYIRASFEK